MARPVYAALLGLVLLAGCAGKTEPTAATSSAVPADDPSGKLACRSLSVAVQAATLMNPGVVDGIVRASATADAPVADAARRLATAYAAAATSHGTDREPDAIAAVSVAGAEMTRICQESGLNAAG